MRLGGGGRGTDWVCYLDHHPACGIHPLLLIQWGWSLFFPSTSHSFSFIHFVPTPTNIVTHWLNWSLSKFNLSIHISAKFNKLSPRTLPGHTHSNTSEEDAIYTHIYYMYTDLQTISTCIMLFFLIYAIIDYTSKLWITNYNSICIYIGKNKLKNSMYTQSFNNYITLLGCFVTIA